MEIKVSKKASQLISTFTDREKNTHDYLIELYKNTIEIIEKSTQEVEVYYNPSPIYKQAIKEQTNAEFRLKYIWQCFQLNANYDYDNKILYFHSNRYQDKDKIKI